MKPFTKNNAAQALLDAKNALRQARRNAAFAALPAAEQRVAIAKDVLALLAKPDRPSVRAQSYYCRVDLSRRPYAEAGEPMDLQSLINTNPEACMVCGIGALFLGFVYRVDQAKVVDGQEFNSQETIHAALHGIFPSHMLKQIEAAFEGDGRYAITFGNKWFYTYTKAEDRLIAILKNIIRNDGTFRPGQVQAPKAGR